MCAVSTVVRSMPRTAVRTAALLAAVLAAGGCAQPGGGPTAAGASAAEVREDVALPEDGGLVLQVEYSGGFATPRAGVGRLPLVSVYADGRVITQGPVAAVHPGPALPNLQVATVPADRVEELVEQALDAGVGQDVDLGFPDVADVPAARITVVTAEGSATTEVHGLMEEPSPDGENGALTDEQLAARGPLQDLVGNLAAAGATATERYVPETVVAVVDRDPAPGATPDDVATWPGAPLPGDRLSTGIEMYCAVAHGEAVDALLEAAAAASTDTLWQNPDGGRWALTLRPLLPHETGCADLPRA